MAQSFTDSLWDFFCSWALIIHILVTRQLKKKEHVKLTEHTTHVNTVYDTGNDIYTTVPLTNTYSTCVTPENDNTQILIEISSSI